MVLPKLEQNRIIDLIPYQVKNSPLKAALSDKVTGSWRSYSTIEVKEIVDKLSLAFIRLGIKPGDTIGLISKNRVEWNFIDLSALQVGAFLVPLYPNNSEDNYLFIFDDANIRLVFVEEKEILDKVKNVRKKTSAQIIAGLNEAKLPEDSNEETLRALIEEQSQIQAQLLSLRDSTSNLELAIDAATTAAALTTVLQNIRNKEKAVADAEKHPLVADLEHVGA